MKNIFEKAQSQFVNKLPFVLYKKPNDEVLNAFFQNNKNVYQTNDFAESGFVFCGFIGKQKILFNKNFCDYFSEKIEITLEPNTFVDCISKNETSRTNHINLVQKGIDAIKKNKFTKVVLSRKESVLTTKFDFLETFKKILSQNQKAFSYVWYHPQIGMWMGAFGEQLLKIDDKKLTTMSLAGTQKLDKQKDVFWHPKEIDEQKIVTEFIVKNLKSETSEIELSAVQTIFAHNVAHLKTDVMATLKPNFSLKNLINQLHPTPAVCGFPKDTAKQFIIENENYEREFYAGFLGELNFKNGNSNQTNLFVNLRCMKIETNFVDIYVGGGITKDSVPEQEWNETENKTVAMKQILN